MSWNFLTSIDYSNYISVVTILALSVSSYLLLVFVEKILKKRYPLEEINNFTARKYYTKIEILRNITAFFLFIITAGSILMVFEPFRKLGTGLLASAGVFGVIAGFAAQKSIAMVLAGIQVAFTQPIRAGDIVIVEGEWGKVEQINLTYVVVCTWDWRRLVIPINYFIEKSFQNWSRANTELIGSVHLQVDYTVPIEEVRTEFGRILANSKYWDGKVKVIHVTDVKIGTLELRALVSAANADNAWELRCEVREKLIVFLQKNYPECLPRTRTEVSGIPSTQPTPFSKPNFRHSAFKRAKNYIAHRESLAEEIKIVGETE